MDASALLSGLILQHLRSGRNIIRLFTLAFMVTRSHKCETHQPAGHGLQFQLRLKAVSPRKPPWYPHQKKSASLYNLPFNTFMAPRALGCLCLTPNIL